MRHLRPASSTASPQLPPPQPTQLKTINPRTMAPISSMLQLLLGIISLELFCDYATATPAPYRTGRRADNRGLLLLLIDGVRWDQITEDLPGFTRLATNGVRAQHLKPVFPTNSFPNYYSIATGLYAESHGILDNFMYDGERDRFFQIGEQDSDFDSAWWDEGDPIWITATRQNRTSHMYNWPGCEARIRGLLPAHCRRYVGNAAVANFSGEIQMALNDIRDGRIQFAGIYTEAIDAVSHRHGPSSPETNETLREVDRVIGELLDWLEQTNSTSGNSRMLDLVDVIVVSDHGMTDVLPDSVVPLSDVVQVTDLERYLLRGTPTMAHLWPAPGRLQAVYDALSTMENITVFKKEDIPTRYHYKNHRRAAPILVSAKPGWMLGPIGRPPRDGDVVHGQHGYLPEFGDMNAMFYATGPSFQTGHIQDAFPSVDIYQIMCHILRLRPSAHNGTWSHVNTMLTGAASAMSLPHWSFVFSVAFVGLMWC